MERDRDREDQLYLQFKKNYACQAYPASPAAAGRSLRLEQSIPVYTVLTILKTMKNELGLEAMLEYMQHYISVIEVYNPALKAAVTKAVSLISMEGIYANACGEKKK